MAHSEKFTALAAEVGIDPDSLHAATATLLCMDVGTPVFHNLINAIGKEGFAEAAKIGDLKRVILGYLVAH